MVDGPSTSTTAFPDYVMAEVEDIKPNKAELDRLMNMGCKAVIPGLEKDMPSEAVDSNLNMDTKTFQEVQEMDLKIHNNSWIDYVMEKLSGKSQESSFISTFQKTAMQSIKWHLLCPLQVVITQKNNCLDPRRNGILFHAVQILKFNTDDSEKILVRCCCAGRNKETFHIKHSDIVWKESVVKESWTILMKEVEKKLDWLPRSMIYPIKEWEKLKGSFNKSSLTLVFKGMICEVQMEENPHFVLTAEIEENYRGLLLVRLGKDFFRLIHMTSPFLHEIGWTDKMRKSQQVSLLPGINGIEGPVIPECVMWKNGIPENPLKDNEIVVFLDFDRFNFFFAHVCLIEGNNFFFHIKVGQSLVCDPRTEKPVFFHISHDHLFSYTILRNIDVEVKLPRDFKKPDTDMIPYSDPVLIYQNYFVKTEGNQFTIASECIGPQWEFQLMFKDFCEEKKTTLIKGIDTLKYVEILLENEFGLQQMHAAKVLKATLHMLTLTVAGKCNPVFAHPHDRSIYHFGSVLDMTATLKNRSWFDEEFDEWD